MAKKRKAKGRPAAKPQPKPEPRKFLETGWFYLAAAAVFLALALIIYHPALSVPFHYDDTRNILENPYIRISNLSPASLFKAGFQDFKQNRPLSSMTFALNFYFNSFSARGYHLVNIFIHVLAALALFILLDRLLTRKFHPLSPPPRGGRARERVIDSNATSTLLSIPSPQGRGIFQYRLAALLISLLWLAHPINTQAVTYIVQRQSAMAGCLVLWSLLFYDLGRSRKQAFWFAITAISGLAALGSKETAFVLPIFILLYELWFFQELKEGWRQRTWKWMAGLCGFYLLLALAVFRSGMVHKFRQDFVLFSFTPMQRLLSQGRALLWYLTLIMLPAGSRQSLEHDFATSTSLFHPWTTLPAFLIIFAAIGIALWQAKKHPLISFAVLWYFGALLIESLPLPIDMVTEHRLYLASIAVIALVPAGLVLSLKNRSAAITLAMIILALLGLSTFKRNQVWQTNVGLWGDTASKAMTLARPWNNYCSDLGSESDLRKELAACRIAVKLGPDSADAHNNLGACYFHLKDYAAAEPELLKAVALKPKFSYAYVNLGLVQGSLQKLEAAKQDFRQALEAKPNDPAVYMRVADFFEQLKDPLDAITAYAGALKLDPNLTDARVRAASLLADQGKCEDAMALVNASPLQDERFDEVSKRCAVK